MNKINKIVLIAMFAMFTNVGFAQKGEILVTATSVGKNIVINYELLNEDGVSGLQFDIALPSTQTKSLSIASCTSAFGKSEFATCNMLENKLRVVTIDPGLGEMKSGNIGKVVLKNANGILDKNLVISRAMLFDNMGKIQKIEPVIDYRSVRIKENFNDRSVKN